MNESELPNRLSHKSRIITLENDQALSQPSSPQRNLKISDLKLQVENYLDQLEQKVTTVKEKNLAEFLVAYKGYMDKIKRDLQLLKQKSDEMEKYYKENERIQSMEKQLEWFREESVKLYTKVEQKNKEIFELKFQIQGLKKENEFLESQVKGLMRKNKQFEVILKTQPDQPSKILDTVQTNIFCTQTKARRIMSSHKRESPQNQQELKHLPYIQEIIRKNSESNSNSLAQQIAIYFETIEKSQIKQNKIMRSKLNSVIGQSTKLTTNKSELEEFFLDCVETIRRDIIKRKAINTFQEQEFLKFNQDYQMFRKEDKFKILEMLLTHEKLIMVLYQKIFPSKFSQQIHTLNTVPNIDPIAQQQDYADLMQQVEKKRSYSTKEKLIIKKGKLIYK